jgi:diguanylate cyclase (GGDEF)-like protein
MNAIAHRLRAVAGREASMGRFGLRLAATLFIALAAAGVIAYQLVSHRLESEQLRRDAALHRVDTTGILDAARRAPADEPWPLAVTEAMDVVGKRPGTLEVILVDRHFRIVAAGHGHLVGRVDRTPQLVDAVSSGRPWVGHEADHRRDQRDFEFVQPVTIAGERYALEITTDGEFFDARLAVFRHDLIVAGLAAWLVALVVFWLFGGRALLRAHRFALQRATRDGLTDLPNHRAFQDALRRAEDASVRYGERAALVTFDVDDFKFVNDRHGHRHGDERLQTVAGVLAGAARGSDQAFRVGGDEFALLLAHCDADGARRTAERIQRLLRAEHVRVSAGAGDLRLGQSPSDLRAEVDAAMREAKRQGGDRVVIFEDIAAEASITTVARRDNLERLLAHGALDVAFQPIWDLPRGALLGVEALARPHADYGFSSPAEAFDTAQQVGRVADLDALCVKRILAQAGELPPTALLFLNLAPQSLEVEADGTPWLAGAAREADVDPGRIVVEVTERVGSRTQSVIKHLRQLADHGFKIAIDDVGSGNSGLEMLRETRAAYVKIDRSIVVGALTDAHARGVLMAVTAFAHETGAYAIAEGIEDQEVLEFVTTLGSRAVVPTIQGGQGYGLGRPAPLTTGGPQPWDPVGLSAVLAVAD